MLFVISQPSTDIKPWCSLYLCSTKFVRTFPFLGYFDPNWEVFISCYYLFILTECPFTSFSRTFQLSCPHNLFQTTESIWSKFLSAHQNHLCTGGLCLPSSLGHPAWRYVTWHDGFQLKLSVTRQEGIMHLRKPRTNRPAPKEPVRKGAELPLFVSA